MKITRKIIEIDQEKCDGCGNCVPACAEGAIKIIDGKAKVIGDRYCDGLGACIGDCPNGALSIVEREAENFDEKAVEQLLAQTASSEEAVSGCPSAGVQIFSKPAPEQEKNNLTAPKESGKSELGHWPVQIRLIPEGASFLNDADLLIAADCVPVACPDFHRDLLKGRAVMIGCPKFDPREETVNKLARIFKTCSIRRITVAIMDVPCCSALPGMVSKALEKSGTNMMVKQIVVKRNPSGQDARGHQVHGVR